MALTRIYFVAAAGSAPRRRRYPYAVDAPVFRRASAAADTDPDTPPGVRRFVVNLPSFTPHRPPAGDIVDDTTAEIPRRRATGRWTAPDAPIRRPGRVMEPDGPDGRPRVLWMPISGTTPPPPAAALGQMYADAVFISFSGADAVMENYSGVEAVQSNFSGGEAISI